MDRYEYLKAIRELVWAAELHEKWYYDEESTHARVVGLEMTWQRISAAFKALEAHNGPRGEES